MLRLISEEGKDDMLARGYSRRQMMRAAMMVGGAAATAFALAPEMAAAQEAEDVKVRISSNECWTGPMPIGLAAFVKTAPTSNRYSPNNERGNLIKAVSQIENVPEDHIMPWPGSNEALVRSIFAFCSPTKSLVQADPSYETMGRAASFLKVPIKNVPLTAAYSHDVKAMSAADANAGVLYVVNPNNVTSHLAAAGKDVLVNRTFSKIFGMAGARVGYVMGRPDLLQKLRLYDGGYLSNMLPVASVACATASLGDKATMAQRRKTLNENRAMTVDFLTKRNFKVIGSSEANMIMVDWKTKSAKDMQAAFRAQGVGIGRSWPTWPNVSRITIGSKQDMEGFMAAFNKVVSA